MDAFKHAAIALTGDARAVVEELDGALGDHRTEKSFRDEVAGHNRWWDAEVERLYTTAVGELPTQAELIGAVQRSAQPRDVVLASAGSLPGDLLKVWRSKDPLSYQVEYGNSVMGYEIAGGLGARMADPTREVYVMSGDAGFLMMNSELATAVQEGVKLIVVLIDNHGYSSVGRVSEQVGCEGFGCHYRFRGEDGRYSGPLQHHDLAKICEGLGSDVVTVSTLNDFEKALDGARASTGTTCIVVETDWHERIPGYATCWWDMATAEVSQMPAVNEARLEYTSAKRGQRWLSALPPAGDG
jgi:3D-(3,5/4)-trihydroxycyclohexane-1,2-dione acylhydrolase (decyclizing)